MARRGTMYDPSIVDVFVRTYKRIMPPSRNGHAPGHQSSRGRPRTQCGGKWNRLSRSVARGRACRGGQIAAFTSLSRAMSGEAGLSDLGALVWTILRAGAALRDDGDLPARHATATRSTMRYAAGAHAASLRGLTPCDRRRYRRLGRGERADRR